MARKSCSLSAANMPGGWVAALDRGLLELVLGADRAGLFTRRRRFVASGEMAVAYWMAHAPQNFFPVNNGGDAAILYCFVFLYLVFAGPGALSLDRRQRPAR
jgi:putative oxidoreductase